MEETKTERTLKKRVGERRHGFIREYAFCQSCELLELTGLQLG